MCPAFFTTKPTQCILSLWAETDSSDGGEEMEEGRRKGLFPFLYANSVRYRNRHKLFKIFWVKKKDCRFAHRII